MANYREDIVNIELTSGTVHRSNLNHTLGGGDYLADRFGVRLYRNNSPENVSGSISGYFVRADGYTVPIASGATDGNKAYITLPAACYEIEGKFTLSIKLTGNGVNGTIRIVDGVVVQTSTNSVASTSLVPSVETLVEDIAAAVAAIPADYSDLWTSLAPAFDATKEGGYKKGDYVTYSGYVWRFTQDHSGAWNSSHATKVSLGSDLFRILSSEYVGMRGQLASTDDMFALPPGSYYISATAASKPANMPGDFGSTAAGYAIVLENDNSESNVVICVEAYGKRVWVRTGYEWFELVKYDFLYERLIPKLVHLAEESYAVYTALSTTKTQYKFLDETGVKDVGSSYTDWYITDQIDVQPYTFYYVTASAQYADHNLFNILDRNGNIIYYEKATSSTVLAYDKKLIFTPNNAAKIQIASVTGADGAALNYAIEKNATKKWVGKKWVVIGDSLTEANNKTTKNYHDYVAEKTGITVVNLGHGGTGYKREYDGEGPFSDVVSSIPTDADVVTIFGSGNDAIYTIGDPSDTGTTTLCGCINTTIAAIFDRITTCQLGIVTPCPWESYNPADDTNWMAQYSAAIVEICKRWGIPCLDLYHCSNLRPWESAFRTAAYSKDGGNGVHPDETGHALLAPKFESFVESLLLH